MDRAAQVLCDMCHTGVTWDATLDAGPSESPGPTESCHSGSTAGVAGDPVADATPAAVGAGAGAEGAGAGAIGAGAGAGASATCAATAAKVVCFLILHDYKTETNTKQTLTLYHHEHALPGSVMPPA